MKQRNVKHKNGCHRIVLTGGPGGGKTTAVDLYRRELGETVVVVPEAATMLYSGGFPRSDNIDIRLATQAAIFEVQKNLEDIQATLYPNRALLCDRGTLDGVAYWPGDESSYFSAMGTTLEFELSRYDAVIFFESAAIGNISIEGGNPIRTESIKEAVALDRRLREIWSHHPNFSHIKHDTSFIKKLTSGLIVLNETVAKLRC